MGSFCLTTCDTGLYATKHVVKVSRPIITQYFPYRTERKSNKLIILVQNGETFSIWTVPMHCKSVLDEYPDN